MADHRSSVESQSSTSTSENNDTTLVNIRCDDETTWYVEGTNKQINNPEGAQGKDIGVTIGATSDTRTYVLKPKATYAVPSYLRETTEKQAESEEEGTSDDASSIHDEDVLSDHLPPDDFGSTSTALFIPIKTPPLEKDGKVKTPKERKRRRNWSTGPFIPVRIGGSNESKMSLPLTVFKSHLRKHSSTGDLSQIGKETASPRRRVLPDLRLCRRNSNEGRENIPHDSSESFRIPNTPEDRRTLEAQFKLLYRENMQLDRAYGELQDKVRSESPQILSNKFLSPRDLDWQSEQKKLKREVSELHKEITLLQSRKDQGDNSEGSVSPCSEKTETAWREKLGCLQNVKDAEIARLREQVNYWMKQTGNCTSFNAQERIAELEQSESLLKCQLLNLEDQLDSVKSDLKTSKSHNDDLGKHCNKLENCLAVLDAEKSLLDELKSENGNLRRQLGGMEEESKQLVGKMAELADENATLERKLSTRSNGDTSLNEKYQNVLGENKKLRIEKTSLADKCAGLEDLKDCFVEQIRSMEEDVKEKTKYSDQVKSLSIKITELMDEKRNLSEDKAKLELDQELKSNMEEKLNERIQVLQDHIETLKSQLENQNRKILSFDCLQENLESVVAEKCDMEAACKRHKTEKQELEKKLADQQERLSESFERANEQLMLETNEMAERQRSLLAENHTLRIQSNARGVTLTLGKKFSDEVEKLLCSNTFEHLEELVKEKELSVKRGINIPVLALGDLASTPRSAYEPFASDDVINAYVTESVGMTLQQFCKQQELSPRVDNVTTIDALRGDLKRNYGLVQRLHRLIEITQSLGEISRSSACENQENEESSEQARRLETQHTTYEDCSKEIESVAEELRVAKEEIKSLSFERVDLLEKLNKMSEKSQEYKSMCDDLIVRTSKLQEEKSELIMLSNVDGSANNKGTEDTLKLLEEAQLEISILREEADLHAEEVEGMKKDHKGEIEKLREKVRDLENAKEDVQSKLEETETVIEDLTKKMQKIQLESLEMLEKEKEEMDLLKKQIHEKNMMLEDAEERLQDLSRKLDEEECEKSELTAALEDEQKRADEASLSSSSTQDKLMQYREEAERYKGENHELKLKLDELENEKNVEIEELGMQMKRLTDEINEQKRQQRESNEERIKEQKNEWERSTEHYKTRITTLEEEIMILKDNEKYLNNEIELKEKVHEENQSLRSEIVKLEDEVMQLKNRVQDLEDQLTENDGSLDEISRRLEEQIRSKDRLLEQWEIRYEQLKTEMEDREKNHLLEKEDTQQEIEVFENEILTLKAEISWLQNRTGVPLDENVLQNRDLTVAELLEKFSQLREEMSDKDEEISELQQKISEYEQPSLNTTSQAFGQELSNVKAVNITTSSILKSTDGMSSDECPPPVNSYRNAMLSEVERLRGRCLKLEEQLAEKEKQLPVSDNSAATPSSTAAVHERISVSNTSDETSRDFGRSMENLIDLDSTSADDVPESESSDSSESEDTSSQKTAGSYVNLSTTESHQFIALERAQPVHTSTPNDAERGAVSLEKADEDNCIEKLQQENLRLSTMLQQAQSDALGLQEKLHKFPIIIQDLQARLAEVETRNRQSGTESDIVIDENQQEEIEKLKACLLETECLVVAHKNKLSHVESLNDSLRLANGRLRAEVNSIKRAIAQSNGPLLGEVVNELKLESTDRERDSVSSEDSDTPQGAFEDLETIPFDKVVNVLCERLQESGITSEQEKEEINRLSNELDETRERLVSLEDRSSGLSNELTDALGRLQESDEALMTSEEKISSMKMLLTMNDANAKESLRSKQEDLEKMKEKLSSLNRELEVKVEALEALEVKKRAEFEELRLKLDSVQEELMRSSQHTATQSQDLLAKTTILEQQSQERQEMLDQKETEILSLKGEIEILHQAKQQVEDSMNKEIKNKSSLEVKLNSTVAFQLSEVDRLKAEIENLERGTADLQDSMSSRDNNIASLSSELMEKQDQIVVLSARVNELTETEEALKNTMNLADDLIEEQTKQHQDEVEQLKVGLEISAAEARRAEMSSEELHAEIIKLEEKNKMLEDAIDGIRKEERDQDANLEAMEMERELMNTSLENAREETREVEIKAEDLLGVNKELLEENEQLQKTIETLNDQVIALRVRCDKLDVEVLEREQEIGEIMGDNDVLASKLANSVNSDRKSDNNREEIMILRVENERLQTALSEVQEQLSGSQKVINDYRADKYHLTKEVISLHSEVHSVNTARSAYTEDTSSRDASFGIDELDSPSRKLSSTKDIKLVDCADQSDLSRLQEQSLSLQSENQALKLRLAALEESISGATERVVPKLDLGSIADESDMKRRLAGPPDEDDTGRFLEECDPDTARPTEVERMSEQLRESDAKVEKLMNQIHEMEDETEELRRNVKDLATKNDSLQKEFFGTIHENFQTQIDEVNEVNVTLKSDLDTKSQELLEKSEKLKQVGEAELQWRKRCNEVENLAEELKLQLQRAEEDNHDLQHRLIDLDEECQSMMQDTADEDIEGLMKHTKTNASVQTITLTELLKEIRREKKRKKKQPKHTVEDTENDISELDSSYDALPHQGEKDVLKGQPQGVSSKHSSSSSDSGSKFSLDDIPGSETHGKKKKELTEVGSEPLTVSTTAKIGAAVEIEVKALQEETLGQKLMIEKLKRRNQELLEGAGAAMTQDDKESLEREVSALRGQVALLQRNNKIFSDRERNELKEDLDLANKRCTNCKNQLQALKRSLEYEQVENLNRQIRELKVEAEELRIELREFQAAEPAGSDDDSDVSSNERQAKYARLLELEEEAEELNSKMKGLEEDVKDRDVMVEELHHQLDSVAKQHREEAMKLEKKMKKREEELSEEIAEHERQIDELKDVIEMKQSNLQRKTDGLEECEAEIDKLQKELQRKQKTIEKLQWEIEALQVITTTVRLYF
ncbi:uncharacterized protein LOC100179040 [Ciona intestinalis]